MLKSNFSLHNTTGKVFYQSIKLNRFRIKCNHEGVLEDNVRAAVLNFTKAKRCSRTRILSININLQKDSKQREWPMQAKPTPLVKMRPDIRKRLRWSSRNGPKPS